MKKLCFLLLIATFVLTVARELRAETWQAPVGGRPLTLAEGQLACPGGAGDWTVETEGHAVRPPPMDDAIGKVSVVQTASSLAACATSATPLTLVATGRWPTLDSSASVLAVDDARLELRGRGLRGVIVRWHAGSRSGDDRCVQPQADAAGERCMLAVGRGLPADPVARSLAWLPAGARSGPDVATFDAAARRATEDDFALRPARIVIGTVAAAGATIDLAGGAATRVPLTHPEAVASAECGAANCELVSGAVLVHGVSNVGGALSLRLRLLPRVFLQRGDALDASPIVQVPVLACGMSVASGDVLRNVDDSRIVVRLDARCSADAKTFRYLVDGDPADILGTQAVDGDAYVLLRVGRIMDDEIAIRATRGPDVAVVGATRARTRSLPALRAVLELRDRGIIDFIPTNRPALVRFGQPGAPGHLSLLPLEGVYEVEQTQQGAMITGAKTAAGFVALRFGYRVESLPGAFARTDLGVLVDPIERPMHEANVPALLGASAMGPKPVVELMCKNGPIKPGAVTHIPYADRDTCRVVFHRERLAPEDGSQDLNLEVDVTRVDGTARPEAHITQHVVLRAAADPRYAWIKGITNPFDRVSVRITHAADESHYVGAAELRGSEPSVQWGFTVGTSHARIYATTAIPTGLYRVSDDQHSGILTLNFGVVGRLTWLDSDGHEGFLGLESGVMAMGLANDLSSTGRSLTQVATVTGLGFSVPIANRSLATETSINIHAWFEYEVSRDVGHQPGSPFGFVFGPSISIGNVGSNL